MTDERKQEIISLHDDVAEKVLEATRALVNMRNVVPQEEIPELMELVDSGDDDVNGMMDRFNYAFSCFDMRKEPVEGETFKDLLIAAGMGEGCDCNDPDCDCNKE